MADRIPATYVLPLRSDAPVGDEIAPYLARLSYLVDDLVVVDGSPDGVFEAHAEAFARFARHLRPEAVTPWEEVLARAVARARR